MLLWPAMNKLYEKIQKHVSVGDFGVYLLLKYVVATCCQSISRLITTKHGIAARSRSVRRLAVLCCPPQEKLAYHRRCRKVLSPGLYLGYLKLCTSVEQIRALVPQKLPNVLCHSKIRDNSHVSR